MKLHLVAIDIQLFNAWKIHFKEFPEVEIIHADILSVANHCIVSPANSHGYMDGGIDDVYRQFFGLQIERTVQEAIQQRLDKILPVGASLVVKTGHEKIPWMIVAPTMEMPEAVPASNAARAMGAILRMVSQKQIPDGNIFCPGLCTLTGRVEPQEAAKEMAAAYRDWKHRSS